MTKIKGNTETAVYIIDKEYHMLHFNQTLRKIFPDLHSGDICYRALCGEEEPCRDCPMKKISSDSSVFYNKKVQQWVEVNTGVIEWPGNGTANVIFCRAVQEDYKNLFYNLTNMSTYDELFELNLTKGTYKILYHKEDKYVIPDREGELAPMVEEVTEHMIYPEDREKFREFWDFESILSRLVNQQGAKVLSGEFRKKLLDGGYCWVVQKAVPLFHGENDDNIVMCFIQDIQEQKVKELENGEKRRCRETYLDSEVGLCRRSSFLEKAQEFLEAAKGSSYCLMAVDIEHFKLFNEWYGQEAGDAFLVNIGEHLKKAQDEHGGIAGYMGDDDFCIILPADKTVLLSLQNQIMGYVKQYAGDAGFLPAFGIYEIEDESLPVSMMYDRAMVALASVKGNYAQRAGWYDAAMMEKLGNDHKLLTEVQQALEENQFTFYAQPKCDMETGRIVGLESLVRWIHPERGLIAPGAFIPLLESNGFISNLDLFVWERVCECLRKWLDGGHRAIPISVNVSRIDLYTMDVAEIFKRLTAKYDLPPSLVEIEITESAYAEEYKAISKVVKDLQKAGFTVLMDDFGSGYSSLNMLKDVNVDILKIDMGFLEENGSRESRGMEILEAIISMAKLMGLRIIAEGVETQEQVETLLDMGCAYAQGYHFYRPMPIDKLEELLADENNIEFEGITRKGSVRLKFERERLESSQRALAAVARIADNEQAFMQLTEENRRTAEAIFTQMTPGGMIGGYCEDGFPLYFANFEMLRLLGYDSYEEFSRAIDSRVINTIHPEDRAQVEKDIGPEYDPGLEYTTSYRMPKKDGTWFWTLDRGKVIRAEDGRLAIVSACTDISEVMEIRHQLEKTNAELTRQNQELYFLNHDMPGGYHRCSSSKGHEFTYVSTRFLDILGYTQEEIKTLFDDKFMNMVHPDDRELVEQGCDSLIESRESYNLEYRMLGKKGYIWVIDQSKYIEFEGNKCIQGVILDVTETVGLRNQMRLLQAFTPENILLIHFGEEGPEFQVVASGLYRGLGYTEEGFERAMKEKTYETTVSPEDYERIKTRMWEAVTKRDNYHELFAKKLPDGRTIWINLQAKFISEHGGRVTYLCVYGDVTYLKDKEQELWLASEKLESILRQAAINCWDWDIERQTMQVNNAVTNNVLCKLYPPMCETQTLITNMPDIIRESRLVPPEYRDRIEQFMADISGGRNRESRKCEFPLRSGDGELVWIRTACETICDKNGKAVRAIGYYMDITEQKKEYLKSRENIKVLQKDALTGLYNRQAAIPKIKKYLEAEIVKSAAMVMLDMDNFKVANDVFGHAYGDAIISKSAAKLRSFFREDDIVCRIGGDEFLVLCKNIQQQDMERKLEEVVNAMKISCAKGGREIGFTVSAGYAMIPDQGKEFDELYRKADVALFTAKMAGKGTYRKYNPAMKEIRYELAEEI